MTSFGTAGEPAGRWLSVPFSLDLACLCAALLWVVMTGGDAGTHISLRTLILLRVSVVNLLLGLGCLALWRGSLGIADLMLRELRVGARQWPAELLLRLGFAITTGGLVLWLRHPERSLALPVARFALIAFSLFSLSRLLGRMFLLWIAPSLRLERGVVIVGTGPRAVEVAEAIKTHPRWRYNLLGFVDNDPQTAGEDVLSSLDQLESLLSKTVVDEVIIALPVKSKYDDIQKAIAACERVGVQSGYSMDFFSTAVAKRRSALEHDGSVVLHMVHNDSRQHLKRALDILGALVGLLLLSPVLAVVAIAVRLTSKGPILFCQPRYGLNKRIFPMYKFRSMVVDAEQQQSKLEHLNEAGGPVFKMRSDPRITRVGRWIRKTSVDELPQLFNVLRGDMSLVGPRPLPTRDVSRFSEAWLMRRFSVRPGMTGLWQVSGRSDTTFANWIALDLTYIDTWSLSLDMRIIARTFPAVLKRQGAA